jgi:hypothetical protein
MLGFAQPQLYVDNFVDNQPNVPCIYHIFFETSQDTNRKPMAFRVVVA